MDVKERVRETVSTKAADVRDQLRNATPGQAQAQAKAAAQAVQRRPFPYAVAAAFVVGVLVGRRSRRKRR
jgi:ElaB/YqjD/DUF883 family membrane-anchored ribosome-binding protein